MREQKNLREKEKWFRPVRQGGYLSALLVLLTAPLWTQTVATEEQVRSAFLFQLAQYVVWPSGNAAAPAGPLRLCVLGQDAVAETLGPLVRGKKIEGREIAVSKLSGAGQLCHCDVAFIGYQNQKQIDALFEGWKYPPVLLVGEGGRFIESGGMVALEIDSGRVSFTVNLAATKQAGLSLRSQLLRFARLAPAGALK